MPISVEEQHSKPAAKQDRRREAVGDSLGRQRVAGIQRARMLAAMAEACAEHGRASVTVAHVVERAGVSRRTFYEAFADVEDCFLHAFEEALARAARRAADAYDPTAPWAHRIRASLVELLCFFEEDRSAARLLIVESLAAGPRTLQRRQEMLAAVIAAVDAGRQALRKRADAPPLTAEGVVGGVLGVLHARLSEPASGSLSDLAAPLASMIVLPYLGAAAAKRELARPVARPVRALGRTPADPLSQLRMRLTYRTVCVLGALAANPGSSNRKVGDASGITDQGQVSKLLTRLQQLGLIENTSAGGSARGEPNAWMLTPTGWDVQRALADPVSAA